MKKERPITTFFSELQKTKCYHCGSQKVISDWIEGREYSGITGEKYWYKIFECPKKCKYGDSFISCYTSQKEKADKILNRKLNGYKITNMEIIKTTIKTIMILFAVFIVLNVTLWLFGGVIKQIITLLK